MKPEDLKNLIAESIKNFSQNELTINALNLFNTLGYNTARQSPLDQPSYQSFKNYFVTDETNFNETKAITCDWNYVDLLFQLTKDEVLKQTSLFDSKQVITKGETQSVIETYLFFVIELIGDSYTRGKLAEITREVNKLFPMPVMILFKYNNFLTLSIINRRLHKRDTSKDVLEKVTLIKDIRIPSVKEEENNHNVTHRAHIEILYDLSFDKLYDQYQFKNFVDLHNAWQKTLDIKELNQKFFKELSNWYFWAADKTAWPDDVEKKKDVRNATNVIRLITRLIFVWFLKEKNLVPYKLFVKKEVEKLLKFSDSNKSSYYKAILQNLFFATLNTEMSKRKFRNQSDTGRNAHYFIHNLFRYKNEFVNPEETLKQYFDPIPFLNGGLFECLDTEIEVGSKSITTRVDGFSDRPDNVIKVPDELFFLEKEKEVDLNKIYGTKNKRYKVRGLLEILNSYKFTITENTPIEEEVALDPELLGKVFENLLASYNPETQTTARKQTGSFYTPREIVNYMVDESIIAYLKTKMMEGVSSFVQVGLDQTDMFGNNGRVGQLKIEEELTPTRWTDKETELENELRTLISYSDEQHKFTPQETELLIEAIDNCKILDPACGSGAFPMGVLHKLVHLLHKLDPENEKWKELQRKKAVSETEEVFHIDANSEREALLKEINETFDTNINYPDYGRKIYLIENCLFGVDIQPIAVQIAKLRFFISLLIEQKVDWPKPDKNYNIKPLPNLETKIVAANTLIGIEKPEGFNFRNKQVEEKEKELSIIRHKHFNARNYKKKVDLRKDDERLRKQIGEIIKKEYAHFCTGVSEDIKREQIKINAGKKSIQELEKSGKSEGYIKEQKEKYSKIIKSSEKLIEKFTSQIENNSSIEATADKIANWDPYNHNTFAVFFDPEWMFGLTKGFDIVIGNPPWVSLIGKHGIEDNERNINLYQRLYNGNTYMPNLYEYFILKSLILLNINGELAFIVPDRLGNNSSLAYLRRKLLTENIVKEIIYRWKFESVIADTMTIIVTNAKNSNYKMQVKYNPFIDSLSLSSSNYLSDSECVFKSYRNQKVLDLVSKIKSSSVPLMKYCKTTSGFGGKSELLTEERKTKKQIEVIKGNCISKYAIVKKLYFDFKEENISGRTRDKIKLGKREKIFIRKTGDTIIATYDNSGIYPEQSLYFLYDFISSSSSDTILVILNSSLVTWYYLNELVTNIDSTPQIKNYDLDSIPIRESIDYSKCFINTAKYLIHLAKSKHQLFDFFYRLSNAMVYELYFPEEIKAAGCEVLKHLTDLPAINVETQHAASLQTIEKVHKELSSSSHPVSIAMQKMQEVEEVRIIEGKQ